MMERWCLEETEVVYDLPHSTEVLITLVDTLGRIKAVLVDQPQEAGSKLLKIDLSTLSPGTYYATLAGPAFKVTGPIVVNETTTPLYDLPTATVTLRDHR